MGACLSVRTVCRVRENSGRYKFGEEIALSKDGEGVHAPAPGSPLGRPSASAFTRKLGGAGPCSTAETASRAKLQPPVRLHVLRESDAGGRLLTRVDPTPMSKPRYTTTYSSPEFAWSTLHFERKHPNCSDRPGLRMSLRVLRHGGSRGGWWESKCLGRTLAAQRALPARAEGFALSKNARERESRSILLLHPIAAPNPSFRHQCVRDHNSASECADCLPRAGDLREIQVWGRNCIKQRRR